MSLLEMSVSGGVLAAVIVIIRALAINRLPKRTFLALWGVALARLLLPYSISLPASVPLPQPRLPLAAVPAPVPQVPMTVQAVPTAPAPVPAAQTSPDLWPVLWAAGVLALALFFLVSYARWRWVFRTSLPADDPFLGTWLAEHPLRRTISVRQSDRIAAPLTYGLLRPVILVPASLDWTDRKTLSYVFAHEYVHIRRFDAAWKLLLAGALCVHWFNPVIWVMYILANRDIELSCDEAVVRSFGGGRSRMDYVLALLAMEEQKSGLAHMNFSRNAMQERIEAIMKYKHASILALALTSALIVGATTTFAVSTGASSREQQDRQLNAQAALSQDTLMSYTDPDDGKTYYSFDGGKTFEPMTDEEFRQRFPVPDVEWWTYEEYAAWLEQEKINLQAMLGEPGWTGGRGDFIWTQELIDETIAMYEGILQEIKEGKMYSKSINGDDNVIMSYDPADIKYGRGEATVQAEQFSRDQLAQGGLSWSIPEHRRIYEPFGLIWNEKDEKLYFKGELVRYFCDSVAVDNGTAVRMEYLYESGTVDAYTVWEPRDNGDGSYDPFGTLVDVRACTREEFDRRVILKDSSEITEAFVFDYSSNLQKGKTFPEIFAAYEPFGVTYTEAPNASGAGNVYYNGQLVNTFVDQKTNGVFTYQSRTAGGTLNLRTVYDGQGRLTGVEEFTQDGLLAEGAEDMLSWPFSNQYAIAQSFIPRRVQPITGRVTQHTGIDIDAPKDTPVLAAAGGTVLTAGFDATYGNYVVISHDSRLETMYAHLSRCDVSEGQTVAQGQTVGTVGSTGTATGPHLHFEVRLDGVAADPQFYF